MRKFHIFQCFRIFWYIGNIQILQSLLVLSEERLFVSQFLNPQEENVETEDKEEINTHKNLCSLIKNSSVSILVQMYSWNFIKFIKVQHQRCKTNICNFPKIILSCISCSTLYFVLFLRLPFFVFFFGFEFARDTIKKVV
jgi:hypothetical protein